MDILIRSNIIQVKEKENVIVNLNITSSPNSINILCGSIYNKCFKRKVPNVIVSLYSTETNMFYDTQTNKYGEYLFFSLSKGIYIIKFEINNCIIYKDIIKITDKINNYYNLKICV